MKALVLIAFVFSASYADEWTGIPDSEIEFIRSEAQKMRRAGLDAKPLLNKAREGIAKKVGAAILRKAIVRERENFEEAARLIMPAQTTPRFDKNALAQSVVIARKRGTQAADIAATVREYKDNPAALVAAIDLLGDLARSGISGPQAVRAAKENASGKRVTAVDVPQNRADMNRAIIQREIRQNLPAARPDAAPTSIRQPPDAAGRGVNSTAR